MGQSCCSAVTELKSVFDLFFFFFASNNLVLKVLTSASCEGKCEQALCLQKPSPHQWSFPHHCPHPQESLPPHLSLEHPEMQEKRGS